MAELTQETGRSNYVDKVQHIFEQASVNDIIKFEFKWLAPKSAIQYIESGCPVCTKVWYENDKIVGYVDIAKTGTYTKGITAVDKDFTVWLADGQERFIANEKMQKTNNPLKPFIRFKISGEVVVK